LDTIGELAKVYAVSEAAFIGGSLIPWGGQNLLEPAFYGRPVVFGPHMENFAALVEDFVGGGGARVVRTSVELAEVFSLSDPEGLVEMGRRAKAILVSLQGASERTLAAIAGLMEKPLG
jgi:3-deoxy-D-manno-octulosonic-acid transferase